jgi:hypothetical protein
MIRILSALLVSLALASASAAQSTAINGTIEGTVRDDQGGVLPGVLVTVVNVDTGDTRTVITNENGLYRAPLLPLGTYRVSAELQGFKKFERTGVTLRAGQTAVIDVGLSVGTVQETVTVVADSPLVDLGKIEQGRTLTEAEIKTLPLTSRNPYNFAVLQPGVVGFGNQEFGVPRITSNGALLRVNYQIDGSNNTQKDRAGLRQMPMSEVMIREVKIVTTGYAPEFGQTMGLIYNAITPSGTNTLKGQGSYRFQRESFAAFPFFTQNRSEKPPTEVNVYTGDIGGPVIRDRTHFFFGYEHTERDLSGARVITITPANQAALGLNEPAYMPAALNTEFLIGKVDHQVNLANRLSVRYIFFDNFIPNNVGGGLGSVQRATDFTDRQHSTAAQMISMIGQNLLNELRVQYATRAQGRVPGAQSPTSGPAINVAGAANFGSPIAGDADAGFAFTQDVFQVNDNLTAIRGDHAYKFGIDFQQVTDTRTRTASQLYTFGSVAAYQAALSGANPFSYTNFQQYFGETGLEYNSNLYGFYVQDDWRLSDRVKILYGVRYDLFDVPDGLADAPFESSRDFRIDKNNWAPRLGVVWTLGTDQRSVLRANTGVMYDQAILAMYEQSLINDGTSRRASATFLPTTAGAPAFPNVFAGGSGTTNTLTTVSPEFQVAKNWQNNIQYERQLGDWYSVAVGASYARGYDLPVITNINPINPIGVLPDGRPIFSAQVNANSRLDPRYNVINMVEAIGDSTYKNMTLQLTRRAANGFQFDLAYTLAKAEDAAPITGTLSVQGDQGRSDPTNLERDRGPHILDQRHTFVGSIVATPAYSGNSAVWRGLVNGTVLGLALHFASGVPINLRSNLDLNADSITNVDRPNGVTRNSLSLPAVYNVDLRLSRQVPIGRTKAEIIAEVKNVFNTVQWANVNAVVTTNAQGDPLSALPDEARDLPPTAGYEQRQFQLGFRFMF